MNDRVERFLNLLPKSRLIRWIAAPTVFRIAWRLGINVRPLIYLSFPIQATLLAIPVGLLLTLWEVLNGAFSNAASVVIVIISTAWGIGCASGLKDFKRKLNLPDDWNSI